MAETQSGSSGLAVVLFILFLILFLDTDDHHDHGSSSTSDVDIIIKNTTITNVNFNFSATDKRELSISFRFGCTLLGQDLTQNMSESDYRPQNMSTVVRLKGLDDNLVLVNRRPLPPPVRQPNGNHVWFVDMEDSLKLNSTAQLNRLVSETRQGKVRFDVQLQDRDGHAVTCPVDVTFPEKVAKALPCA